jgi:hypothetical protein
MRPISRRERVRSYSFVSACAGGGGYLPGQQIREGGNGFLVIRVG